MNDMEMATCHCIVAHPSKPKFMLIRHSDGWQPPVVGFPAAGFVGNRAQMIADGVMNKYGLQVYLRRQVVESANYHCIELEQLSGQSTRKLEAVWVGTRDYRRMRPERLAFDPLRDWLADADKGWTHKLRPPWERRGWFRKADHWIQQELDRLNIQVTGSIQQVNAFRPDHLLLKVNTVQGSVVFRAGWEKPPAEAALEPELASRWPGLVETPLAADAQRNWLLYRGEAESTAVPGELPKLAAALARFQVEASTQAREWAQKGCHETGMAELAAFLDDADSWAPVLSQGDTGLSDDERAALEAPWSKARAACTDLAAFSDPKSLVHAEPLGGNLVRRDQGLKIRGWSDVALAHPFFSAHRLLSATRDNDRAQQIRTAYLEPFRHYDSPERLNRAFDLTAGLAPLWQIHHWYGQLEHIEPGSPARAARVRAIQGLCRRLIRDHDAA